MLKITAIGNLTHDVELKMNEATGKPYAIVGHGADDRRVSRCPGHGDDHHGFLRADGDVCHHITG